MSVEMPTVPKGMEQTQTGVSLHCSCDEQCRCDSQSENRKCSQVADAVPVEDESNIIDLIEKRADNRVNGHVDAIIVVAEWATQDEYDIVDSRLLLAGNVHDHSEKALRLEGGFEVDVELLPDYDYMTNVVSSIDGEYDNDYLPKSSVETIIQLSPAVFTDGRSETFYCSCNEQCRCDASRSERQTSSDDTHEVSDK